jgi:exopolyphosphatase/pppGpp-phosphohydrolase
VGGTASNLVKIVPPDVLADRSLTSAKIEEAFGLLAEHPASTVSEAYGVSPTRASILPAGAAILGAILERFASDRMTVIDTGIREGLIHAAAQAGDGWRDALPDLAAGWRN